MKTIETKEGVFLDVLVKPKSGNFMVVVEGDDIIVHCSEAPQGGRVNRELIKELSRLFNRKVEFISGFSSRRKRVLVLRAVKVEVEQALSRQARAIRGS